MFKGKNLINKNDKNLFGQVILVVSIQILRYIKYLLTIPLVLFYTAVIFMTIILIQELFGGNFGALFNILNIPDEGDKKDILKIYGWLSLFFYIIGSLIEGLFKTKLSLSFKRRLKFVFLINLFLVTPIVFVSFILFSNESITSSFLVSLGAFLMGMIFGILAFGPGSIINKIMMILKA